VTAIDPQAAEAETIRQAVESLRTGNKSVAIEIRGPLANWLEDAWEGDSDGVINPYAFDVAKAILANSDSRRRS
jgi:hypothetical protein